MNDDDYLNNTGEIILLKSLNLESNVQQDKEDKFEIEFNNLLSKITNQINIIKNKSVNSFQFKPLNIDFDIEKSSSNLSLINDSINNNNSKDINNNSRYNNNYSKDNFNSNNRDNNKNSKPNDNIKNHHTISNKPINLHFVWNNNNDKEYIIKIGQKDSLKDTIDKLFMENYDDLQNYNIKCVYLLSGNKNKNKMTLAINKKKETKYNNNVKKIFDIQKGQTLDNLNINDNTYIYFETEENIAKIDESARVDEEAKFKKYLMQNNNENKQLIVLKTASNSYSILTDKNITFSELFNNLKNRYRSLKDVDIKVATYNNEKIDKNKYIAQYKINSHIILYTD